MRPRSFRGRRCRGYTPVLGTGRSSAARLVYPFPDPPRTAGQPMDSGVARQGRLRRGNMCSWCDNQEVISMADDVRTSPRPHILNTDGQPHPLENAMAIFVLLAGLVSFVLGLVVR